MLKKLLVWVAVLLVAALLAVPALAQTTDPASVWGSDEWLVNQFGDQNGDITNFCNTVGGKPDAKASWEAEFPNLANVCGWS